jgi:hypothetical protein
MTLNPFLAAVFTGFLAPVLAIGASPQDKAAVTLGRIFRLNEKFAYELRSSLHTERRAGALNTWIPSDLDYNYDFTEVVQALKADGIGVIHYRRPTLTEVHGETFDSPSVSTTVKVGLDYQLTLSPFNEVLDIKNLRPQPTDEANLLLLLDPSSGKRRTQVTPILKEALGELYQLSLFVGPLESSLDLAPKRSLDPVNVGDTWKRTVGYQPQRLKGKGRKQAVQRLDYTFTYKGVLNGETGKVFRVQADLSYHTDLMEFLEQIVGAEGEDVGKIKIPVSLSSTILFDLDMKTKETVLATATSEGSFKIENREEETTLIEEKLKGHTTLRLVGRKILKP